MFQIELSANSIKTKKKKKSRGTDSCLLVRNTDDGEITDSFTKAVPHKSIRLSGENSDVTKQ